ncbi:uncharacterized protein LOC111298021 [Durio zibethinus]|uniref:Uncharacterized protein LOC111298021 n=1 Tax=Durio zibethinus TaxID=66656 RepID=A0A6P5Z796_DURZI|nr:uncharacterized protein LOC111298021 [Durio zibethinus]
MKLSFFIFIKITSPKMKRIEVSAHLIIAFLLLTTSQSQFSMAIRIGQAMETVGDDIKMITTAKPKPNSANRLLLATWEPGTQFKGSVRKAPSAPNPIGNKHPPSKP